MTKRTDRSMCRCLSDQSGATAIEYGLIAGLIALAIIASVAVFGTDMQGLYETIADAV